MMGLDVFELELRQAIEAAPRMKLPDVAAVMWRAFGDGRITEAQAEALSSLIEIRKVIPTPPTTLRKSVGSRPRSPASVERRRRWAASGALPVALASRFTMAEQAALAVVADEVRRTGDCRLCVGAIAGKAGIGETSVRNALRGAKQLGLVTVEERRVAMWRNLPNVVRIVSPEWLGWLLRGREGAFKFVKGTDSKIHGRTGESITTVKKSGIRREEDRTVCERSRWTVDRSARSRRQATS